MKYNAWSRERLVLGTKHLTSRKRKHHDSEVIYIVGPLPWHFIKKFLYRDEGAESPKELQGVINQIFSREVIGNEVFFVHFINPELALKGAE